MEEPSISLEILSQQKKSLLKEGAYIIRLQNLSIFMVPGTCWSALNELDR